MGRRQTDGRKDPRKEMRGRLLKVLPLTFDAVFLIFPGHSSHSPHANGSRAGKRGGKLTQGTDGQPQLNGFHGPRHQNGIFRGPRQNYQVNDDSI